MEKEEVSLGVKRSLCSDEIGEKDEKKIKIPQNSSLVSRNNLDTKNLSSSSVHFAYNH